MVDSFVPERGDIVWLDMSSQAGHEQNGRRPVLVLSPRGYNKFGLACVCPITNQVKGYPFEIAVNQYAFDTTGVVLADQIRNVDWIARNATLKDTANTKLINLVTEKIAILLQIE